MARIRSVHPSLFTDEAFMSCSMAARQLMIGLWCEAYCDGVFEWKPLTLKARLFPVDSVDVGGLLAELEEQNVIKPFDANGKAYGAIRNFRKFQRPKSPKPSGALPEEMAAYVGILDSEKPLTPSSGEKSPAMTSDGQTSPKSLQMEDGGCKVEDGKKGKRASASFPEDQFQEFWDAYAHKQDIEGARKAFVKALKVASFDDIMAGVRRYVATRDPKFIKYASGWLNGKRWTDEPSPQPNGTGPPQGHDPLQSFLSTPQGSA